MAKNNDGRKKLKSKKRAIKHVDIQTIKLDIDNFLRNEMDKFKKEKLKKKEKF